MSLTPYGIPPVKVFPESDKQSAHSQAIARSNTWQHLCTEMSMQHPRGRIVFQVLAEVLPLKRMLKELGLDLAPEVRNQEMS